MKPQTNKNKKTNKVGLFLPNNIYYKATIIKHFIASLKIHRKVNDTRWKNGNTERLSV